MAGINFVETEIETLIEESKALVESLLGRTLSRSDPLLLFMKSLLMIIVQQRELINDTGRQNLLQYARGENLDALGVLVGCKRLEESAAFCTVELELSAMRRNAITIPAGTRVATADKITYATADDVTFLAGETKATVKATCLDVGEIGNGFEVGEIKKIVDPQPFLKSIRNITVPEGGADVESDDSYRERIRIKPESFSVAGSKGAYEYWAKTASPLVTDVAVSSPTPGVVDVYPLLQGGEIPQAEMLERVYEVLTDDEVRPLTDFVTVKAPEVVSYDIEARYWINREYQTSALAIQEKVESAVTSYELWQKSKIGRDISPTELNWKLREAGAYRVEIISPLFTELDFNQVAVAANIDVTYMGLKDV